MTDLLNEDGPTSPESITVKSLRILIAEDTPDVASLLEASLAEHTTMVVSTAKEAIEEFRRASDKNEEYDWLITDLGLAGPSTEDGFYLVSQMQGMGLARRPYVTMLTGRAEDVRQTNTKNQLLKRGVNGLLGKPFSIKELYEIIPQVREAQAIR